MAIPPGGIVRVTAVLNYAGLSELQNVFYMKNDGVDPISEDEFSSDTADFLEIAYADAQLVLNQDVLFDEIRFYDISNDSPMVSEDWPALVNGAGTTEASPLNACALVAFPTGVKRSVGRKYLSGIDQVHVKNGGALEATGLGNIQDWGDHLAGDYLAGGQVIEIGNWRPATDDHFAWQRAEARLIMATQKRRRIGVGV